MEIKEAKDYLNSKDFILEDNQELNEGVLTIAGGVALGLIALKVFGKVLGVGLKGLVNVLTQANHLAILKVIDRDKDIIASELKEYMLADAEVAELIENKSITVKQIQNWIEKSSNKLIQPEYKANGLKMANNELHDRQLKSRGWKGGVSGGLKGHFDNYEKISEISSKLAQIVYDTIYEVKNESTISEGAYKDMNLNEAKEILKENGFMLEGSMSLEDKIYNAKAFNIKDKLPKPTKDDLYGYRRLCSSFASLKNLIVKKLKYDFDEETIEAILKAYGDRIYFNVMKSQLPSDELATTIVGGLLELLDELN